MNEPNLLEPLAAADRRDRLVRDSAVEVTIAFAPMSMSVAEVEALRSGGFIELGCRLAEAKLAVHVGERQIATGRFIVLAEGGAAVRLNWVHV